MDKTIHHGRNVKRFRELFRIKQEGLAMQLGDDWNQKKISILESKEEIDDALLEQIGKVLHIPVDAIKNFDEETAVINIQNNYEGANSGSGSIANSLSENASLYRECNFNPLDKYVEAVDEIRKLYADLLQAKEEQIKLMERLINKG